MSLFSIPYVLIAQDLFFPEYANSILQTILISPKKGRIEKLSDGDICALKFSLSRYKRLDMRHSSLPLSKILLPYDGSPSARLALKFAAQAGAGCETIHSLTLLHVTAGGYLARHIQNVDLRVTRLEQTKEWQRIRQRYLEEEIQPLLTQGQGITD